MSKLILVVPVGRRASGRAVLLGNDGKLRLAPFRVLATASGSVAARRGNPERDWRRPFGDTPVGSYVIAGALPPGTMGAPLGAAPSSAPKPPDEGRPGNDLLGALVLSPVGGNALEALRAGRARFLVHGGPLDAEGRLLPTFGGVRVSNPDLAALIGAVNQANADGDPVSSVEIEETSTPAWQTGSADQVPSSRDPARARARAGLPPLPRGVRAEHGFGTSGRSAKTPMPSRRAFVGLALFAVAALEYACNNSSNDGVDIPGAGGAGGGDDGGGVGGGYGGAGGYGGGPEYDGGTGTHSSGSTGTHTGTTTGGSTTTGGDTTTTTTTTTGGDTTTTGVPITGSDTTTTGVPITGGDVTAPPATGTDVTGTGTDSTGTGTDVTGTGTDGTGTGTDGTGTGTDVTGTGTDGTGTGTDGTGTDSFRRPGGHRARRRPPGDEGTGT